MNRDVTTIIVRNFGRLLLWRDNPQSAVDAATELLAAGADEESIVAVASLFQPTRNEALQGLSDWFLARGLAVPTLADSALDYIRELDLGVHTGNIDVYAAGRELWSLADDVPEIADRLDGVIALTGEIEDSPTHRDAHRRDLAEEIASVAEATLSPALADDGDAGSVD